MTYGWKGRLCRISSQQDNRGKAFRVLQVIIQQDRHLRKVTLEEQRQSQSLQEYRQRHKHTWHSSTCSSDANWESHSHLVHKVLSQGALGLEGCKVSFGLTASASLGHARYRFQENWKEKEKRKVKFTLLKKPKGLTVYLDNVTDSYIGFFALVSSNPQISKHKTLLGPRELWIRSECGIMAQFRS